MKKISLMAAAATVLLGASCTQRPDMRENPFFARWDTPHGVPPFDRIRPEHFKPAVEEGIRLENAEIEAIASDTSAPGFENVILAYDNSGQFLSRVMAVFNGLNNAETSPKLQSVDEELTPLLSRHNDEIALNPQLFDKIKAVYDRKDDLGLDARQTRLLEKIYRGFVRSGAGLNEADKAKLKELNERISMLSLRFGKNLLADNKAFVLTVADPEDLSGLPESVREAAAAEAKSRGLEGKWVFTLDKPSLIPFLQYADNRSLREKIYTGYLKRGDNGNENDNREIVKQLVQARAEKARLLGYETYAHFVLDRVMAKTPENVYGLLDQVWAPALERAQEELAEMKALKASEGTGNDFASWDWWYYAEKVRQAKYALDENMLRPYFSLETVREGIFTLAGRLYGLTFRPLPDAPKYHADNQVYEVTDRDGSHLGVLYLDFFPRPGKRGGAWCGSYRPQAYENGVRVAPVSTVVCNFTPPSGDAPALLSPDETETFFHECGHALHGLMSNVEYRGLRGVERDFVELPSQIMENWTTAPQFLKTYAKHYRTGEPIPDSLIVKMERSAKFNQGFMTVELLAASYIDMDIHTLKDTAGLDIEAFQQKKLGERDLIPEIEPRYRYPYFQHIFSGGYASGYYSYIWAEVLDADAFVAFAETGDIFNPETAASFRENILSKGGTEDGAVLYRNFRGKDPDRTPLLRNRGLIR